MNFGLFAVVIGGLVAGAVMAEPVKAPAGIWVSKPQPKQGEVTIEFFDDDTGLVNGIRPSGGGPPPVRYVRVQRTEDASTFGLVDQFGDKWEFAMKSSSVAVLVQTLNRTNVIRMEKGSELE